MQLDSYTLSQVKLEKIIYELQPRTRGIGNGFRRPQNRNRYIRNAPSWPKFTDEISDEVSRSILDDYIRIQGLGQ